MGIAYTTNFHVPYMDPSTPFADVQLVTQQLAQLLDAAMGRAGYTPPDATSFAAEVTARQAGDAALSGRVTSLEQAPSRTAPVALGLNSPWLNFGSGWAPLRYWSEGRTGFAAGFIKPSSNIVAGDYQVAAIPANGPRPPSGGTVSAPLFGGGGLIGRLDVTRDGVLNLSIGAVNAGNFIVIKADWPLDN